MEMLSERSPTQKDTYCMMACVCEMSGIGKSVGTESRQVVARGWLEGGSGSDCSKGMGNFLLRERLSAID